jgi:hypothetical protein
MRQTFSDSQLSALYSKLENQQSAISDRQSRTPVHVVYGGAHLFRSDTPQKLGKIALKSLETYTSNFVEFSQAVWLKGADALPIYQEPIVELENRYHKIPNKLKMKITTPGLPG